MATSVESSVFPAHKYDCNRYAGTTQAGKRTFASVTAGGQAGREGHAGLPQGLVLLAQDDEGFKKPIHRGHSSVGGSDSMPEGRERVCEAKSSFMSNSLVAHESLTV